MQNDEESVKQSDISVKETTETTKNLAGKTISGMVWKFFEKFGSQIMMLVIQIVLARILLPDMDWLDY